MKKESIDHKVFSARTSRLFYVFWAIVFVLYLIIDTWLVLPEAASMILLILIVGFAAGVRASIAYTKYRIAPDLLFIQGIRRSKEYKWGDLEGYEIKETSILSQIFTSAPSEYLELSFSDSKGKVQKEKVFNADSSLISELDEHLSKKS